MLNLLRIVDRKLHSADSQCGRSTASGDAEGIYGCTTWVTDAELFAMFESP